MGIDRKSNHQRSSVLVTVAALVFALPGCKTMETKATPSGTHKIVKSLENLSAGTKLHVCSQEYGELSVNGEHVWTVSTDFRYEMNFPEAIRTIGFVPTHPQLRKMQPSAQSSGATRAAYVLIEKKSSNGYFIPLPGAFITGGKVALYVNFTDKNKFEKTCGEFQPIYLAK